MLERKILFETNKTRWLMENLFDYHNKFTIGWFIYHSKILSSVFCWLVKIVAIAPKDQSLLILAENTPL